MTSGELMMHETTRFRERDGFTLDGDRRLLLELLRAGRLDRRIALLA